MRIEPEGERCEVPVGTKQVPGVTPPTTPYFFSLPERSRQEKAPHRLARCAGSLRPADVWRADKLAALRHLSAFIAKRPPRSGGGERGKPTPKSQRSEVGAALVVARVGLKLPSLLKEGLGVVGFINTGFFYIRS